MAQGGMPNSAYLITVLLEKLARISKANGNYADVKTVKMPNFPPLTDAGDLSAEVVSVEAPAYLVWLDTRAHTGGHLGGNLRGAISVIIVGVVKEPSGLQMASLLQAEDLINTLIPDQSMSYPGSTDGNDYGVGVELTLPPSFGIRSGGQSLNVGTFLSGWRIGFQHPRGG